MSTITCLLPVHHLIIKMKLDGLPLQVESSPPEGKWSLFLAPLLTDNLPVVTVDDRHDYLLFTLPSIIHRPWCPTSLCEKLKSNTVSRIISHIYLYLSPLQVSASRLCWEATFSVWPTWLSSLRTSNVIHRRHEYVGKFKTITRYICVTYNITFICQCSKRTVLNVIF